MYFGDKFLLEIVGHTVYMLPNTTYFETITIFISSPVNLPLQNQAT